MFPIIPAVKVAVLAAAIFSAHPVSAPAAPTTTYTVQPGDTLSGIALSFGITSWPALYAANVPVVGGDPNLIFPGEVLTLVIPASDYTTPLPAAGAAEPVTPAVTPIEVAPATTPPAPAPVTTPGTPAPVTSPPVTPDPGVTSPAPPPPPGTPVPATPPAPAPVTPAPGVTSPAPPPPAAVLDAVLLPAALPGPAPAMSIGVPPVPVPARVVTVQAGDTLSGIAAAHGVPWPSLWGASRAVVGADPDLVYAGEVLTLPVPGHSYGVRLPAAYTTQNPRVLGIAAPVASAVPVASGGGIAPGSSFEQCVIDRESSGNAQVMNSSGHYGLYQFSASSWAEAGGNPADFGNASPAEQQQVFDRAYALWGTQPWAPSDGC